MIVEAMWWVGRNVIIRLQLELSLVILLIKSNSRKPSIENPGQSWKKMEDDQNGKQLKWKTTKMVNDENGRRPE